MNPIRMVRLSLRAKKAANVLDDAAERPALYQDRVWWDKALTAVVDVLELAPVPPVLRKVKQMKNWKTTLSGVAGLLAIAVKVVNGGGIATEDLAVVTGLIGLIFAKDFDRTGTGK